MRKVGEPGQADAPVTALSKLGEFLRGRRLLLTPARAGIEPTRRRRTPGLRREEVASVAGISVDWYTRIELGTGAIPSVQTLHGIARALQLNNLDTKYLFELADLPVPQVELVPQSESLNALERAILQLQDTAAIVYDLYGSPLCWNATADGLFRWSRFPDAFSRNMIVAGLTSSYYREFFGRDFDSVARKVVGLFRRAYTTANDPPALARRIYAFALEHAYFRELWEANTVADDFTETGPFVRHVPEVGELVLDFNDLVPLRRHDLIVRFVVAHDDTTLAKLPIIEKLGTASAFIDPNV